MFTQLQDIKAYEALVDIPEFRFVNIDSGENGKVDLGAAGGVNFPVAKQGEVKQGHRLAVQLSGSGKVVAAESIAQGQIITSNGDGKAVVGNDPVVKIALNDADEDELVEFKIM